MWNTRIRSSTGGDGVHGGAWRFGSVSQRVGCPVKCAKRRVSPFRQHAGHLRDDAKVLELDCPRLGKFARSAQEFAVYVASNVGNLINYGERFRSGERISSALKPVEVGADHECH